MASASAITVASLIGVGTSVTICHILDFVSKFCVFKFLSLTLSHVSTAQTTTSNQLPAPKSTTESGPVPVPCSSTECNLNHDIKHIRSTHKSDTCQLSQDTRTAGLAFATHGRCQRPSDAPNCAYRSRLSCDMQGSTHETVMCNSPLQSHWQPDLSMFQDSHARCCELAETGQG